MATSPEPWPPVEDDDQRVQLLGYDAEIRCQVTLTDRRGRTVTAPLPVKVELLEPDRMPMLRMDDLAPVYTRVQAAKRQGTFGV